MLPTRMLRGCTSLAACAALASCAALAPPAAPRPQGWLEALAAGSQPPAGPHWPLPPPELERLLATGEGEILAREKIGAGVTGSERVTLRFPSLERDLDFKWREAPEGDADGWNNTPRKELAAYAVQKWFLAPEAYVVPTVRVRCIPLESYRASVPDAEPTLEGSRCVLGTDAVWLQQVKVPEVLYHEARFLGEPHYARHMARFNLLTYLIEQRDSRRGNVLVAEHPANRRVFAVDNGIAFGGLLYNFFTRHWNTIRVPALPRAAIERLRRVGRSQAEALAVLAQLELDAQGVLRPAPPGAPFDAGKGARWRGGVLQLGLTAGEIQETWERRSALLARVDAGEIPLF